MGGLTFGDSEGCLRDNESWREGWVGAVSLAIAEKSVSDVRKGLGSFQQWPYLVDGLLGGLLSMSCR